MPLDKSEVRRQIESLEQLPPLPEVGRKILELRAQPEPNAAALAQIVELDPSLSAQVIRYARSSLYGYRGNIESVETAIARVLGYDTVLNLALGLATAKPFDLPDEGPLGVGAFWSNAITTAVVAQRLAQKAAPRFAAQHSLVYLSGLLHEFGLLVLGHLFPDWYREINIALEENPATDLIHVEYLSLGVTHGEAGARALRFWDLPDELVVTALKHGDPNYDGLYAEFARLVYVANTLLKTEAEHLPETESYLANAYPWFTELGLRKDTLHEIILEAREAVDDIDTLVRQIAA